MGREFGQGLRRRNVSININVKNFLSHVNPPTKHSLLKRGKATFMTQPCTSLVTVVLAQWEYEWSSQSGRDGGQVQAQGHRLPFTEADPATAATKCLTHQQQKANANSQYSIILQVVQPTIWREVDFSGLLSWERQEFIWTGIVIYFCLSYPQDLSQHHQA